MEKYLSDKHGKKIIGWDEILEGGLAPSATVMSWRGEEGGIAAANMGHEAIMTPGSGGMYIDQFQGDPKIEPVSIGGYDPLSRVYAYNPTPDTLVATGKANLIKGVQTNLWSEYMYNTDLLEYRAIRVCWHWLKSAGLHWHARTIKTLSVVWIMLWSVWTN